MNQMTIGDYFNNALEKCNRNAFDHLSNGCVDWTGIKASEPKAEILKCCRVAVARVAGLPFAGRITLAKIMADAMALLQQEHGLSAPRCWYPVIKRLREQHKRDAVQFKRLLHAPGWRPERFEASGGITRT